MRPQRRAAPARRPGSRRLAAVAGAVVGAVTLTACSSSPGSSSATTSTSSRPTSTTQPPTTTTQPATTTTGSSTCQVAQLRVVPQSGSGAAGTIEMSVDLTNQSSSSCTLFGYPGMQLLDGSGNKLPTNVVRGGGPQFGVPGADQGPATVVLAPQHTAAFSFSYSDVPVGTESSCPMSTSSLITPPGDLVSGTVALAISPCGGGTIHVSPVYSTS